MPTFRHIFFILFGAATFINCIFSVTLIQFIFFCTVRKISKDLYYKICYYLLYSYGGLMVYYIDWYCNSEMYLYMNVNDYEKYYGKEHKFFIVNHRSEVDLLFTMSLFDKSYMISNAKPYIRDLLKYVPGFGTTLRMSDWLYLSRDFAKDKILIERKLKAVMNYPYFIILVLAPEGTRYTKEKHAVSAQYAKENNLPVLKHHLNPRTRGFLTSLPHLRAKNIAVYSATWVYEPNEPNFIDAAFHGKKLKAHCYLKRIPFSDVPENEEDASRFLHYLFKEKDDLVDRFLESGDFRTEEERKTVTKTKLKGYLTLAIGVSWHLLTIGMLCYIPFYLFINEYNVLLCSFLFLYLCTIPMILKFLNIMSMRSSSSYGL